MLTWTCDHCGHTEEAYTPIGRNGNPPHPWVSDTAGDYCSSACADAAERDREGRELSAMGRGKAGEE